MKILNFSLLTICVLLCVGAYASGANQKDSLKFEESPLMADTLKDVFEFGPDFKDWRTVDIQVLDSATQMIIACPPSRKSADSTESIRIIVVKGIHPSWPKHRIDKIEKTHIKKILPGKVVFTTLKNTPSELIFSYVTPNNTPQSSGIVRSLISDLGYYSISYAQTLPVPLEKEELDQWKERLEAIKIKKGSSYQSEKNRSK
ncbi:MAG: hypothetical protein HYX48_01780 [Chlamydiales bacterium]|nr:hypothetical protein [Chlamydiales bacterium]